MMETISVAQDFSVTPGFRDPNDGPYSGAEFRERYLEPHFGGDKTYPLEVDLDGTAGYATSFLEEAFGGLARKYGPEAVLRRITIKSDEDPLLADEVRDYIRAAR